MPSFKQHLILACAALAVVAVPVWAQSDSGYYEGHSFDISPVPIQPVVTNPRWGTSSIGGCRPTEARSTEAALARAARGDSGSPLEFLIVDEAGIPVNEAAVLIAQRRRPWRCLAFSTDEEGILSLDLRRPKRRHDLLIRAPGFRTRLMTWSPPLEPAEQHRIELATVRKKSSSAQTDSR